MFGFGAAYGRSYATLPASVLTRAARPAAELYCQPAVQNRCHEQVVGGRVWVGGGKGGGAMGDMNSARAAVLAFYVVSATCVAFASCMRNE